MTRVCVLIELVPSTLSTPLSAARRKIRIPFFRHVRQQAPFTPGSLALCRQPWMNSLRCRAEVPSLRLPGPPDAERVVILMGSGADTARQTAVALQQAGEKVGVLQVRLFGPSRRHISHRPARNLPAIAVLEQTKEPGATGEPLYLDIVESLAQAVSRSQRLTMPRVIGGRYGLSSKDFNPAMAKAVFDELKKPDPRNSFTVGINDDVSHSSLDVDASYSIQPDDVVQAVFYGLGSDGTVGANKNSVKIIAEDAGLYAQGYFVYDSHKSGAQTISHLRFGPQPIRSPYLINSANFLGCHQFHFLERQDVLDWPVPAPRSFSIALILRVQFGITCRVQSSNRLSTRNSNSLSSMQPASRRRSGSKAIPILSSRPASSLYLACCRASRPLARSRHRFARPTERRAMPWCSEI